MIPPSWLVIAGFSAFVVGLITLIKDLPKLPAYLLATAHACGLLLLAEIYFSTTPGLSLARNAVLISMLILLYWLLYMYFKWGKALEAEGRKVRPSIIVTAMFCGLSLFAMHSLLLNSFKYFMVVVSSAIS